MHIYILVNIFPYDAVVPELTNSKSLKKMGFHPTLPLLLDVSEGVIDPVVSVLALTCFIKSLAMAIYA
jgi:hypothetical protein